MSNCLLVAYSDHVSRTSLFLALVAAIFVHIGPGSTWFILFARIVLYDIIRHDGGIGF